MPYHVEHFKEEIPRYLVRQQVRPGCTGWAQIHGLRGDTDIAERIRYDIWYIENWTVALDIKIIFRTVFGGKMVNDENYNNACALPDGSVCNEQKGAQGRHRSRLACRLRRRGPRCGRHEARFPRCRHLHPCVRPQQHARAL